MRKYGRVDANQPEIVRALKMLGASVQPLSDVGEGCPDLLVGFRGKNVLLEVKDEAARICDQKLTEDQDIWHKSWQGSVIVVRSAMEALKFLNSIG